MEKGFIVCIVLLSVLLGSVGTVTAAAEFVHLDEMGDEYSCEFQTMYPGEMAYYGLEWNGDYSVIALYFPNGGQVRAYMKITESVRYTNIECTGYEVVRNWNNCANGPGGTTTSGHVYYYWRSTTS